MQIFVPMFVRFNKYYYCVHFLSFYLCLISGNRNEATSLFYLSLEPSF